MNNKYMTVACDEARHGIEQGHGGPFGCVIVKDGIIVGVGHNRVLVDCDPTAHGEITAIRNACKNLNTHDLSGCDLFTTGEPCPMCMAAIMWARIQNVYYAKSLVENSALGFDDRPMYDELGVYVNEKNTKHITSYHVPHGEVDILFYDYMNDQNKQLY